MNSTARILLVGAGPGAAGFHAQPLRGAGHDVREARSDEAPLDLMLAHRPDLVLLDATLSKDEALTICRQAKAAPALAGVFLVVIAAPPQGISDRLECLDAGADEFILEPLQEHEFLARIRTLARLQQTAAALRASEEKYRRLLDILPDGLSVVDMRGGFLQVNQKSVEIFGYDSVEDARGKTIFDFVAPEGREQTALNMARVVQQGATRATEYVLLRRDGNRFPAEISTAVLKDDAGQPRMLVSLIRDVSERKAAEEKLRRREAHFRALLENALDIVLVFDEAMRVTYASPSVERVLGHRTEDMVGKNLAEFLHPDERAETERFHANVVQHASMKATRTQRVRHRDGSWRMLEAVGQNLIQDPDVNGIVINARDVTQQHRSAITKETLLSLVTQLNEASTPTAAARAIFAAADALWDWDSGCLDLFSEDVEKVESILNIDIVDGTRCEVPSTMPSDKPSPRMRRVLSSGPELILRNAPGEPAPDSIPFGDVSRASASIMTVPIRCHEVSVGVLSVQSYQPTAFTAEDLRVLQGLADHCGGALERIQRGESLRTREASQSTIIQTAMDGFCMVDRDGRILEINDAYCRMSGYTREELVQLSIPQLEMNWPDPESFSRRLDQIIQKGRELFETRHRTKDGRVLHLEISANSLDPRGERLCAFIRDITARKEMEAMLRRREEHLRLGMESADMVTWDLDLASGRIEYSQNMPAFARGDDIARYCSIPSVLEEIHPEDREALAEALKRAADQNSPFEHEYRARMLDGAYRWILARGRSLVDASDQTKHLLGISMNVTQRKHAEQILRESEQTHRALIETTSTGYLILDSTGMVVNANNEYVRLSGHSRLADILGRHVVEWTAKHDQERNAVAVKECLRKGRIRNLEIDYAGHEGAITPVEINATVVETTQGKRILSLCRDISTRRAQEKQARSQTLRLQMALEAAGMASWEWDVQTGFIRYSDRAVVIAHGENLAPFSTVSALMNQVHPDDKASLAQAIDRVLHQNLPFECEYRVQMLDASYHWILGKGAAVETAGGMPERVLGVSVDITERKESLERLRQSEERYRTLAEASPDAVCIISRDGIYDYVNSHHARWLQRRPEEIEGLHLAEVWPAGIAARLVSEIQQVLLTGDTATTERPSFMHPSRWVETRWTPLTDASGRFASILEVVRDITERKQAEEALRDSEERYRTLVNNLNVGVFRASVTNGGRFIQANPALASIAGYARASQLQQFSVVDLFMNQADRRLLLERLERDGRVQNHAVQLRRSDGRPFFAAVTATAHFGMDGKMDWIDGVLDDITERRQAEEALRRSEATLRGILQATKESIWLFSPSGVVLMANPTALARVGLPLQAILGRRFTEFMPPLLGQARMSQLKAAVDSARPVHFEDRRNEMHFHNDFYPVLDDDGQVTAVAAFNQDITDRKRSESLLSAQRDLGITLSSTTDLQRALDLLLEVATRFEGIDCGGVYLAEPGTGQLDLKAHRGLSAAFAEKASSFPADSPQGRLVHEGRPCYARMEELGFPADDVRAREGLRALAVIPLLHEGQVIGSLNLASHQQDEVIPQSRLAMEAIAPQVSSAIARIHAEAALQRSEAQLRSFFDSPGALRGIAELADDDILLVSANSGLAAAYGRPQYEMGRRMAKDLGVDQEMISTWIRNFQESQRTGQPVTFDYKPAFRAPGRHAQATVSCIGTSGSGSPQFAFVSVDITERKQAEEALRQLPQRVFQAQEEERTHVSRELHDGINQLLVSTKFRLHSLEEKRFGLKAEAREIASRCCELIGQALEESRRLSHALRPRDLDDLGLSPACRNLCTEFQSRTGITVQHEVSSLPTRLGLATELHLFRIVQEALNNIAKHAQATRVALSIIPRGKSIELKIEDNGCGFDPHQRRADPTNAHGLGLPNMAERARILGGEFTLQSTPGRGTCILVRVPRTSMTETPGAQ